MRVFETTLDIQPDGRVVLHLPEGLVGPGVRKAVIVMDDRIEAPDEPETPPAPEPLSLPQVPVTGRTGMGPTRREDLYGESGR